MLLSNCSVSIAGSVNDQRWDYKFGATRDEVKGRNIIRKNLRKNVP